MNAKVIVGLGWGDEGKGLMTDYLCSQSSNPIVIRFSGGQQAGHTVMIGDKKHVHSSFGSGTLRGVPSYFSEHTSIYLSTMDEERFQLMKKGIDPKLYVHPMAKVTTPYDVAYNRAVEKVKKHGSVGLGIAATMKRHHETGYKIHAVDMLYPKVLRAKLDQVKNYYGAIVWKDPTLLAIYTREMLQQEAHFDYLTTQPLPFTVVDYSLFNYYDDLIFEGSQGIMLDMDHGIFPNVTWGNTTSKNAMEILGQLESKQTMWGWGKAIPAEIFYITRCYQTRHGNGWMSSESPLKLVNNEEEINISHTYQGNFRVGELDYDMLNYAMDVDGQYSSHLPKNLVVTCLDQLPDFKFDYSLIKTRLRCSYENNSPHFGNIKKNC